MSRMKPVLGIILTIIISMVQVGGVFAAPTSQEVNPISGTVQSITLETDPTTDVVTVVAELRDSNQIVQKVRLSQKTAKGLGLIDVNGDGNPVLIEQPLGEMIEIDPTAVIPDQQESQHPVGSALATFFSDIEGMDYDTIMSAHEGGVGFGVIAQALWLTSELGGDAQLFQDLLYAKQHNDYAAFSDFTDDRTTPKNWGQLRKALLNKKGLGVVMSNRDKNGNQGAGNESNKDKDTNKDKDKKDNGHGSGNGHGNGNGTK